MKMSSQKKISLKSLSPVYLQLILLICFCLTCFFACEQFSLIGEIEINLPKPLTVSPEQITLEEGESCAFSASGGVKPYTFTKLNALGTIDPDSGAYTAPTGLGTVTNVSETIRVTDAKGVYRDTQVVVLNPNKINPLMITPQLITVAVNSPVDFLATNGQPGYTFEVIGSGTIISTGVNSCTYTAPSIAGVDIVQVTDALGSITLARVICVADTNPVIVAPGSVTLVAGSNTSITVSGGTPPYTYTILYADATTVHGNVSGAIPPYQIPYTAPNIPGLAILTVTDSAGKTGSAEILITSNSPSALKLSPSQVALKPGESYVFQPVNGVAPYEFELVFGDGQIDATGKYTAPDTIDKNKTAKVRVTDSTGTVASALIMIKKAGN